MRIIRMLGRSIRDAFKSVIRNFSLSLASISCITITLIIVAIAIMASFNVQNFTQEIEKDLTIVIFLNNEVTDEDITRVEEEIKQIPNVDQDSVVFASKQDVKEEMQQESEVFDTVLDEWDDTESPLKDTFQVKVKNVEKISDTAERIEKINQVNTVRYGEGMVDQMISAFSSIEKVTYGVVIALVIVTVFLIINTIKLTISARRREIGIMRLVGASNFTIKTLKMPGKKSTPASTTCFAISSQSRKTGIAWKFIKLVCSDKQVQQKLMQNHWGCSVMPSVIKTKETARILARDESFKDSISTTQLDAILKDETVEPKFKNYYIKCMSLRNL